MNKEDVIKTGLVLQAIGELTVFHIWNPKLKCATAEEITHQNNRLQRRLKLTPEEVTEIASVLANNGVLSPVTGLNGNIDYIGWLFESSGATIEIIDYSHE